MVGQIVITFCVGWWFLVCGLHEVFCLYFVCFGFVGFFFLKDVGFWRGRMFSSRIVLLLKNLPIYCINCGQCSPERICYQT